MFFSTKLYFIHIVYIGLRIIYYLSWYHVLIIIINKTFLTTENNNKVIKMYTFNYTHYIILYTIYSIVSGIKTIHIQYTCNKYLGHANKHIL